MTTNNQQILGKTLWGIANELRGAMMADDFRDYMLSFLFWKYLSDNYIKAAQKELGSDYPILTKKILEELKITTPLQLWYYENNDDIVLFEEQMRRKIHYVIQPIYLWDNIVILAKKEDIELLRTIEKGFKFIEDKSFESSLRGLFSEPPTPTRD